MLTHASPTILRPQIKPYRPGDVPRWPPDPRRLSVMGDKAVRKDGRALRRDNRGARATDPCGCCVTNLARCGQCCITDAVSVLASWSITQVNSSSSLCPCWFTAMLDQTDVELLYDGFHNTDRYRFTSGSFVTGLTCGIHTYECRAQAFLYCGGSTSTPPAWDFAIQALRTSAPIGWSNRLALPGAATPDWEGCCGLADASTNAPCNTSVSFSEWGVCAWFSSLCSGTAFTWDNLDLVMQDNTRCRDDTTCEDGTWECEVGVGGADGLCEEEM